jgi:hypothetical protein
LLSLLLLLLTPQGALPPTLVFFIAHLLSNRPLSTKCSRNTPREGNVIIFRSGE